MGKTKCCTAASESRQTGLQVLSTTWTSVLSTTTCKSCPQLHVNVLSTTTCKSCQLHTSHVHNFTWTSCQQHASHVHNLVTPADNLQTMSTTCQTTQKSCHLESPVNKIKVLSIGSVVVNHVRQHTSPVGYHWLSESCQQHTSSLHNLGNPVR